MAGKSASRRPVARLNRAGDRPRSLHRCVLGPKASSRRAAGGQARPARRDRTRSAARPRGGESQRSPDRNPARREPDDGPLLAAPPRTGDDHDGAPYVAASDWRGRLRNARPLANVLSGERMVCVHCRAEAVSRWRRRAKRTLVDEAGGACAICGYDRCVRALEFHHVDPATKRFGLGSRGLAQAMDKLRAEVAKCVLLCANCHAEVEAGVTRLPFARAPRTSIGGSSMAERTAVNR